MTGIPPQALLDTDLPEDFFEIMWDIAVRINNSKK
jgi:hypothetical protein